MNVLVINCGSSSVKYQLINVHDGRQIVKGLVEQVNHRVSPAEAFDEVYAAVKDYEVHAVGHRVVHGGSRFTEAVLLDNDIARGIEDCCELAPLHTPHNLAGIRFAMKQFPDVPQAAVFDTAFHSRLPERASLYAIDYDVSLKHGIRRYGFHGTSHDYVSKVAADAMKRDLRDLRIITLHLGNGASACAVEYGHSVETSMGMTPLEGLVMGTRSGDIGGGAMLEIMRREGWGPDEMDAFLNKESGLKGVSGIGNDLREILSAAEEGHERARLAINVFVHRARKYIGAYAAVMGGVDAIVMTGGIGENSNEMRRRILQRFDFLGLLLDDDLNDQARVSHDSPACSIHRPHSRVHAWVIKTNEELMIARQTAALARSGTGSESPGPIPIAVSARHVHLTAETFKKLFGEDAEPTRLKSLSQPGQFACHETVNLIGPRNRIDGVRLLGPFRSKNQVEISRTDEFRLGIDAPVRNSGHTDGSAPITLEGPAGTVHLEEGLICAKRHIHMTPEDAERFGVKDRDEVEVAIEGGPRDLVFGDVLIRVSPKYALEMHIDTDEANAVEFDGCDGELVYSPVSGSCGQLR